MNPTPARLSIGDTLDAVGVRRWLAEHRVPTLSSTPRPWYVQSAVAVVIWGGALFFASFLTAMRLFDAPVAAVLLGLIALVVGAVGARARDRLLGLHVALLGYAAATTLIIGGVEAMREGGEIAVAALVQLVCLLAFDSRPVRFKATVGFWLAGLAWVLKDNLSPEPLLLAVVLTTVFWWALEPRLLASKIGTAVRPVGFALAVVTIGAGLLTFLDIGSGDVLPPESFALALGLVLCVLVLRVAQEARASLASRAVVLAILGVAAATALAWHTPVVLVAGIVLVLGRLRREVLLDVLGAIGLVASLMCVYAQLDLSLLMSSGALATASVLILVARQVALGGSTGPRLVLTGSVLSPIAARSTRKLAVLLPALLTVFVVFGLSWHKESLIHEGRVVLLPLAPVDPRSLMQGDYMRLRYQHARALPSGEHSTGVVVAFLDEGGALQSISNDVADYKGQQDAVLLKWHRVRGDATFGADSFFFPEGEGKRMEQARYAEMRAAPDGTLVLVGLRDQHRVAIEP